MSKKQTKKTDEQLSEEEKERMELLQKAHQSKGKQLRIDAIQGDLTEVNELRELLGKQSDNPEEKYNLYYNGIRKLLMKYLPAGPEFKEARQLIYDEKNVFLNRGKKKSDNNGIRKSDGRMTYQEFMSDMLDLVAKWVTESQNPVDLYTMIYELNEKHGYGHEVYDDTSKKHEKVFRKKNDKGNE